MTFAIIVLCVLGAFVIIIKTLEDRIGELKWWKTKADERISFLEVKDLTQDKRLDAQQTEMKVVRETVYELGKDIGWDDSKRRTKVIEIKKPKDRK